MKQEQFIAEILENTISNMLENKNSIISIADTLKADHKKKQDEICEISEALPIVFQNTKKWKILDRKVRNELVGASAKFSDEGYKNLERMLNKANQVHEEYLKAEQEEYTMIRRRDALELELKQSILTIEKAENVAQQLMVSLTYLQNSLSKFNEETKIEENIHMDETTNRYLEFFQYMEEEKVRMARDIHDGPAQQIVGTLMNVELCNSVIPTDRERGMQLLAAIKQELSNTLKDIRQILFDLNPAPLEKMSLQDSIHTMLHSILDPEKVNVNFFYTVEEEKVSKPAQKTIYRIIQELVNNVKKHAKASEVLLRIINQENFLYIYLMDNGVGFKVPGDLEAFRMEKNSYGISNIYSRVKELNGTVMINSDVTNGTAYKIQLPML